MKKIINGIFVTVAIILLALIVSSMLGKPEIEKAPENFEEVPQPQVDGADYIYDALLYYQSVAPEYLERKDRYDELVRKKRLTDSDSVHIKVLKKFLDDNLSLSIPPRENIIQYVDAIHVSFVNQICDSVLIIDFIGELGKISPGINGGNEILVASKNLITIAKSHQELTPFIRHAMLLNDLLYFRYKYYGGI